MGVAEIKMWALCVVLVQLALAATSSASSDSRTHNSRPDDAGSLLTKALAPDQPSSGGMSEAQRDVLDQMADVLAQLSEVERAEFMSRLNAPSRADISGGADTVHRQSPPRRAPPAAQAASGGTQQRLRRTQQQQALQMQSTTYPGWCLEVNHSSWVSGFKLEVDEGSDLSLVVAHVAKILIEDKMGFDVELISRHEITNSIDRVALGEVDASVEVQLSERRDVEIYEERVRNQELALDLGPTGYANSAGWFVANGHLLHDPESCTYQDYWHTFTQVPALEMMLTANEVEAGVNDNGNLVCNPQDGGFCQNEDGKYFGRACNSDGFAIADITRPCRVILAHYPSYDYSVNEQLVNNLDGNGLEFGIVWLGWNATQIITDRASRGEIFLFHHWHFRPFFLIYF